MLWQFGFINQASGRNRDAIIFNKGVEPVGSRTTSRAEECIEPVIYGTTHNPPREIHTFYRFHLTTTYRVAILIKKC